MNKILSVFIFVQKVSDGFLQSHYAKLQYVSNFGLSAAQKKKTVCLSNNYLQHLIYCYTFNPDVAVW